MRRRVSFALCRLSLGLSLVACSSEAGSEGEAGSESESESESESGEVERACPCIPISDEQARMGTESSLPDCGDEQLCPTIVATIGPLDEVVIENPADLDCALEALRDRTPGLLSWDKQNFDGDDEGYVLIQADGMLIRRNWGLQDLAWIVTDSELGAPLASGEFEACLIEPDLEVRLNCVRRPLESASLVCDEGWGIDVI